jgi:hypothetical protein
VRRLTDKELRDIIAYRRSVTDADIWRSAVIECLRLRAEVRRLRGAITKALDYGRWKSRTDLADEILDAALKPAPKRRGAKK